tara:strand:- start:42 stop:473 length:432 start_codon:yes stop_codon:yes gene_type:complete
MQEELSKEARKAWRHFNVKLIKNQNGQFPSYCETNNFPLEQEFILSPRVMVWPEYRIDHEHLTLTLTLTPNSNPDPNPDPDSNPDPDPDSNPSPNQDRPRAAGLRAVLLAVARQEDDQGQAAFHGETGLRASAARRAAHHAAR